MRRTFLFFGILVALLPAWNIHADALDDRLAKARLLLNSGKSKEAATEFEALKGNLNVLLKKTPGDAHLNFLYGSVCMDGGDAAAAAASFDKAISLAPKNAQYLTARALLFWVQEKPAEALSLLKRAAEAAPGKAESWGNLARAQSQASQLTDANESIKKAIAINPKEVRYLGMLAELLMEAGKSDEALITCQQAVMLDANYTLGYLNIGQLHQAAGRFTESLSAYERATKLDSEDWRAQAKIVQLHEALGKPKERDAARDKVFALWKAGKVEQPRYCREQFKHNTNAIMVFEYFELTGDRAVRYSFHILDESGKSIEKISLGSYGDTTNLAQELGSIKTSARMFHLDSYIANGHATIGMFRKEPNYEKTRQMVVDYLDKKLKPVSSTTYPPEKKDKE